MKKFQQKVCLILNIFCLIFAGLAQANGLSSDPFVREAINRKNFEPGGKYHLFSSRGTVADRKGNIAILSAGRQNIGGLLLEQVQIKGKITYNTQFSGHEHNEHSPFANSSSRSDSDTKGQALIGFTTYKLNWSGKEIHPADAYDGEQGGGYPAPTGARDEYTYNIKGNATRVEVQFDDNRSALDRFKNRFGNAGDILLNGLSNAWNAATTHNPDLDQAGNAAEVVNATVSGVESLKDSGFEIIGANDAYQGLDILKDIATMEALRALPSEAQLQATADLTAVANAYDDMVASYYEWAKEEPNLAEVVGFG